MYDIKIVIFVVYSLICLTVGYMSYDYILDKNKPNSMINNLKAIEYGDTEIP